MFKKTWLCDDGGVVFLHLFLIKFFIFSPYGDVNVLSWDSSVVLPVQMFLSVTVKTD